MQRHVERQPAAVPGRENPQPDRDVLPASLDELAERLTLPDPRPYSAVLALAGRRERAPDEVRRLSRRPRASARLRRRIERRLATEEA
jgi:hypothetical protein